MMVMKEWCLGFIISKPKNSVVLLKKSKTMHIGLWNGVGGKLEADERPIDAMVRECSEETPLSIAKEEWLPVGRLTSAQHDNPWCVWLFTAYGSVSQDGPITHDNGIADYAYQVELRDLKNFRLAPHTEMLIYASIEKLRFPNACQIDVMEIS